MEAAMAQVEQAPAAGAAAEGDAPEKRATVAVKVSVEDKRKYRVISLSNGLTAILVHDPEMAASRADRAATGGLPQGPGEGAVQNGHLGAPDGVVGDGSEDGVEAADSEDNDDGEWETDSEGGGGAGGRAAAAGAGRSSGRPGAPGPGARRGSANGTARSGLQEAELEMGNDDEEDEDEDWEDEDEDEEEEDEEEEEESDFDEEEEDDDIGDQGPGARGHPDDVTATKKAAAAMCVGVGTFSDPPEAQGLAHFLEHMLFMGSSKYPDENDYDAFLAKHGGGSNAFTETECTVFHFDVNQEHLKPALDRFAQFFIAPLAKADAMDREVRAVDSEFTQVIQSDGCRLQQLQCHTAHPAHPFHKFSWGNRRSLTEEPAERGVDMRAKLMELYLQHYRAGAMKLAVLGGEPLDVLEEWVREIFGAVRGGGAGRARWGGQALPPLWEGGRMYRIESVKEQNLLTLSWALPCLDAAYTKKPHDYISHLIGHEGEGSLLALLKAKGWVTGLSAGVGEGGYERNTILYIFAVHMTLTAAGLENAMEVIDIVYQYISLLRSVGPQEWVFKELQAMAAMEFRFAEESSADDYTVRLATNAFVFAEEDVVYGDYAFDEWDPALVSDVLDNLQPGRMRVDLVTKAFDKAAPGVKTEPWFGTPYAEEELPGDLLRRWAAAASPGGASSPDPALKMPPTNEFIPRDFSLRNTATFAAARGPAAAAGQPPVPPPVLEEGGPSTADGAGPGSESGSKDASAAGVPAAGAGQPRVIFEDARVRLWYKEDDVFATPRADAYFGVSCAGGSSGPRAAALTELFVKLLEDALSETIYLANVAKLESAVSVAGSRIELKIYGFNDKLAVLAEKIFASLRTFRVRPDRFEVMREELVRVYQNANMKPLKQSVYMRLQVLKEKAWTVEEKLAALAAAVPDDVTRHVQHLFSRTYVEGLAHGNLTEEEARALVGILAAAFSEGGELPPAERGLERVVELPGGSSVLYSLPVKNGAEDNSVVEMYFQGSQDRGRESVAERALFDLFEQCAVEPMYNELRTKQQLGYRVDCGVRATYRVLGFCFRVQSAAYDPVHLQARIEAFIIAFRSTLEGMSEEEFESHRSALIAAKLEKDHSLLDETDRYWEHIWEYRYLFDAKRLESNALREVTRGDLLSWYDGVLAVGSASRRKLTVQVWGHGKAAEGPRDSSKAEGKKVTVISSPDDFKSTLSLFPRLP